ncbi:uncharacterized protein PHALS_13336 [Plasmopara halstedii]|uniref:Uncharacterized protein n=1 Tax=Plasmopara halstedii TaxID=4781 RepID=A0A0P1AQJ3_PLAHL|nr:uncharacterized protein PHALS_13336 [Plasmopara halstedii]CEG43119.1 hypothetical protein PHALS_13336 [Plasmopara halstedii]|eukprot:XP_024579488.1 hypothetical protein PHALS_13336 [Plasmopara halstedii]
MFSDDTWHLGCTAQKEYAENDDINKLVIFLEQQFEPKARNKSKTVQLTYVFIPDADRHWDIHHPYSRYKWEEILKIFQFFDDDDKT